MESQEQLRQAREQRLNGFYEVMDKYGVNTPEEVEKYVLDTARNLSKEEAERFGRAIFAALLFRTNTQFVEVNTEDISNKLD